MKFRVKQWLKMLVQNILLPFVYRVNCWRKTDGKLVVFADAHHSTRPESMERLYSALNEKKYQIVEMYTDYGKCGMVKLFQEMCSFMKVYAKAGTVVICDNYLPVTACKKKSGTRVIQLWHGAGALKKFGYDAADDIPVYYRGEVYKNYDLVTVSSRICAPYFVSAMHLKGETVKPYGISRTDAYFDTGYKERCREQVYCRYPEYRDKKILLWAPTFRGNAAMPRLVGLTDIQKLEGELGSEWRVIYSLHPHLYRHLEMDSMDFSTEQLIPAAEVLVSDYSSVLYDAALLGCPILLFAPDLEHFQNERGFYMPLTDFPGELVTDGNRLKEAVLNTERHYDDEKRKQFCKKYLSACDGKATDRIVSYISNHRAEIEEKK